MLLDEAIRLQEELEDLLPEVGFNKYQASTQLGIEALKFKKALADSPYGPRYAPLPGETKE